MTFEVEDDTLEVGFVEDRFLLGGAEEEGGTTEVVDLAGDALGVVVDERDEAIGEDGVLAAGNAEVVFDVGGSFLEVEGFEVVADGDTLMEGFVGSEAELVSQVGLTEQNKGDEGGGVHVVIEEEAELVEDVGGQEVSFVDDQQGIASLAGEVGEGRAELGEEAGETKSGLGLKSEEDLAVERVTVR